MVKNQTKNFQWISNKIFSYIDYCNEMELLICYEAGISENDYGGITNSVAPRISFKLKSVKSSSRIDIDLEFSEIILLCKNLENLKINNKDRFVLNTFTKNSQKQLTVSINKDMLYLLLIEDPKGETTNLHIGIDRVNFFALQTLLIQTRNNWLQNTLSMYTMTTNHRLISELNELNSNYIKTTLNKSVMTTKSKQTPIITNEVLPILEKVEHEFIKVNYIEPEPELVETVLPVQEPVNDMLKEFYNFNKEEILSETLKEEVQENYSTNIGTDIPEDNVPFDTDVQPFVKQNNTEKKFELTDEYLENFDLSNPPKEYIKPVQTVSSPRPFFNNFIDWDVEYLYKWLSAFSVVNENSKDLTFLPFELILTNSIGKESFKEIKDSKDYYFFQYNILNNLKNGIIKYINEKDSNFNLSFNRFEFTDVKKITDKNDNIYLWNFIVDISLLNIMYKYFLNSYNKLNIKDQSESIYNIKLSELFTSMISIPLIKILDSSCLPELSKDIANLYSEVEVKGVFENLVNIFSYKSQGGKFNLNFEGIYKYLDKFIEVVSNNKVNNVYDVEINNLEDIKKQFTTIDTNNPIETDKKLKVFNKVLETELIDNTDFINLKSFSDIDIIGIGDPIIIKVWKLVKDSNSNIKISDIKRKLKDDIEEESNPEIIITKVEEKEPVELKQESFEIVDMFSIEDSDEFDIYNLINN